MSKGSPIIPVRVPAGLLEDIEVAIAARNAHASGAPWTRSDFFLIALREKLGKMERSRRGKKKSVAGDAIDKGKRGES